MTLEELRGRIDVLDRQLVELLNERARAALLIGHLKAATSLPVYEPAREKVIYNNVRANNKGPLPDIELTHIYERIIDVMRALQRNELASERHAQAMAASAAGRTADPAGSSAAGIAPGHGTGAQHPLDTPSAGEPTQAPETGTKQ
jgi:chorismate mutase